MPKKRLVQRSLDDYFRSVEPDRFEQVWCACYLFFDTRSVAQAYAEFELLTENEYVHRPRRETAADDIPLCSCDAYGHRSVPCKDRCENRGMQVECVEGNCSTGRSCGNQRFQSGELCSLLLAETRDKGIKLVANQAIQMGEFIVQYTGEVITRDDYELREMAVHGCRHHYGVAIDGDEVIDARYKGSVARFANHSCAPNCELQKWVVNGETCCGLFARRAISFSEELTFSYAPVFRTDTLRMACVKCVCGKAQCCGYIPMRVQKH